MRLLRHPGWLRLLPSAVVGCCSPLLLGFALLAASSLVASLLWRTPRDRGMLVGKVAGTMGEQ